MTTARQRSIETHENFRFENNTLFLTGNFMLDQVPDFLRYISRELRNMKNTTVAVNLQQLENIDSAGVSCLYYLEHKFRKFKIDFYFEKGHEGITRKMEIFSPARFSEPEHLQRPGFAEKIGDKVEYFFRSNLKDFLILSANVFYFSVTDFFRTNTRREGETANQAVLIGVNAVLIVAFMSFIIGLVLAVQSAQQLRMFGANIYIVDLTVITFMSQMGPLITAILVAGRSGSAIAAEIATMKVTSELDALQTMGLNPVRFVVVPKLYASLITMPFLIVIASVSGIAGGALAAYFYLDITPEIFINRMGGVMENYYLITGFVKSQVYASVIVLTGSYYGFRVVRGAEGVGKSTTSAVVMAISMVIIADSILGLLFY
jgi:phospholipid/cholesterol/gamma-HCH transport system permease protein